MMQGSRVFSQMRLNSAKAQTESSPVLSIDDLVLWLETTLDGTVTNSSDSTNPDNNDKVSSWNDINSQLVKKVSATQTTDSQRPAYIKNGINDLPSISFDGTNDNLSSTNICTGSFTAFAVIKTSVAGTNSHGYLARAVLWADRVINSYDSVPLSIGGGFVKIFNGSPDSTMTGTMSVSNDAPHIVVTSRDLISGARNIYVDGASDGSDTSGAAGKVLNDAATILIGGNTIDSVYYSGHLGEIIIFERVLKDEERKEIEKYLSKKWNVKIS